MPYYDYYCPKEECDATEEVQHKMDEAPLVECPHGCGLMKKGIAPIPAIYKCTGFYQTDKDVKRKKPKKEHVKKYY